MGVDWNEYRGEILASASADGCRRPPLPPCAEDQNYIFISYAHEDYKAVYCDLLKLCENGVRFWYDEGIDLGPVHWSEAAQKKLADPRCVGAIFYVSPDSLMSPSVMQEIEWFSRMREEGQEKNYFAIYLGSSSIDRILYESLPARYSYDDRKAKGLDGKKMAFLNEFFGGTGLTREAEPESDAHLARLLEQIAKQFNVMDLRVEADEFFRETRVGNGRDGYAEVTYRDGMVYKGFLKDYQRDGEGQLYDALGNLVYDGSWKNGKYDGFGRLIFRDGRTYEGYFKNNKFDGQGKMTYAEDDLSGRKEYEGAWANDRFHGYGVFRWNSGSVYEGNFSEGYRDGEGIYTYSAASACVRYEGNYVKDKVNGFGKLIYRDGSCYEGDFKNGKLDGQGKMTYAADDSLGRREYEGAWANDWFHGHGVLRWNSGSVYEGNFSEGYRDGEGIYTYSAASACVRYEGNYVKDKVNGFGKLIYRDGSCYEGEFKNGKYDGRGKLTHADGSEEEGIWKEGTLYDGKGIVRSKNGDVYEGTLAGGKKSGTGKMTFSEKDSRREYEGEWADDRKNGHGVLRWKNGTVYEGEFAEDKLCGKGRFVISEGEFYEGEFAEGTYNGFGTFHYAPGNNKEWSTYEGHWKDGEKDGEGILTFAETSKYYIRYEGNWVKDRREGFGRLFYRNGRYYEGEFAEDKLCGKGRFVISEGEFYEGEFAEGTYNGFGTFHYAPDDKWGRITYEGYWKNGKRAGYGVQTVRKTPLILETREGLWENGRISGPGKIYQQHLSPEGVPDSEKILVYEGEILDHS